MNTSSKNNLQLLAKELEGFVLSVSRGEAADKRLQSYVEDIKGIMLRHITIQHKAEKKEKQENDREKNSSL